MNGPKVGQYSNAASGFQTLICLPSSVVLCLRVQSHLLKCIVFLHADQHSLFSSCPDRIFRSFSSPNKLSGHLDFWEFGSSLPLAHCNQCKSAEKWSHLHFKTAFKSIKQSESLRTPSLILAWKCSKLNHVHLFLQNSNSYRIPVLHERGFIVLYQCVFVAVMCLPWVVFLSEFPC